MSKVERGHPRGVPFDQVMAERLQDPEFARAYAELEPEFRIIRQLIARRNELKLTQAELAKRAGTGQPTIARLETTGHIGTLASLTRIAEALDSTLEIQLVPKKDSRPAKEPRRARQRGRALATA